MAGEGEVVIPTLSPASPAPITYDYGDESDGGGGGLLATTSASNWTSAAGGGDNNATASAAANSTLYAERCGVMDEHYMQVNE